LLAEAAYLGQKLTYSFGTYWTNS